MLKAIGFSDDDLARTLVGIANTWIETMPCNYNLRALAVKVKEGVRAAGGTPMEFNTVAVSDGVTMGTEGRKAWLIRRGAVAAGKMTEADLREMENIACPGAGACGGQYTANTMATVMEFIGLSPFGTASVPAMDPRKNDVGVRCGKLVMEI